MKDPNGGGYGIWDYLPKTSGLENKISNSSKVPDAVSKSFLANWFNQKVSKEKEKEEPIVPSKHNWALWANERRLTGRLRFPKGGIKPTTFQDKDFVYGDGEDVNVSCRSQFTEFCNRTSLHGYSHIVEPKRSYAERYGCKNLTFQFLGVVNEFVSKITDFWHF